MKSATLAPLLCVGAVLHCGLLVWGTWQDSRAEVAYTDIDYSVFSDAADLVTRGRSPYERHTYRYTPLLAYALVPNCWFPLWGKVLFSVGNLVMGFLLASEVGVALAAVWVVNPFAAQIATRGSADCLPVLLVVACYAAVKRRRIVLAGILFGCAVHLKIYPIIYGFPLVLHICGGRFVEDLKKGNVFGLLQNRRLWLFGVPAATVFLSLFAWLWTSFGYLGVFETYLYHSVRIDHRHNFSPFYPVLYALQQDWKLGLVSKAATLIQWIPVICLGLSLWQELELALFVQTVVFVAFNRVVTSQYFIWWLGLLPLALSRMRQKSRDNWRRFLTCLALSFALWIVAQALWLYFAYRLEFKGEPQFVALGCCGALLLVAHTAIALTFLQR